jgi:hypothetical protein
VGTCLIFDARENPMIKPRLPIVLLFIVVTNVAYAQVTEGKWKLYSTIYKDRERRINKKSDRQTILLKNAGSYVWTWFKPILPDDTVKFVVKLSLSKNERRSDAVKIIDKNGIERKVKYRKVKDRGSYRLTIRADSILFTGDKKASFLFSIENDTIAFTETIEGVLAKPMKFVTKFIRK